MERLQCSDFDVMILGDGLVDAEGLDVDLVCECLDSIKAKNLIERLMPASRTMVSSCPRLLSLALQT